MSEYVRVKGDTQLISEGKGGSASVYVGVRRVTGILMTIGMMMSVICVLFLESGE